MSVKSEVLKYLETNRNDFLSGELIANTLNVTRNAVNKAVNSLRDEGYEIVSITNKGYRLTLNNDILSREGILPYLKAGYRGQIYVYDTVASTNNTAKELAAGGCEGGTAVIANSQTNGRGRLGRSFYSPKDSGLYMSVILKPDSDVNFYSIITVAVCVAVCKAVHKLTGIETDIKWVNDIYLNGRKICGILTEGITDLESGRISRAVVGIGINISTDIFPEDIGNTAGSLYNKGVKPEDLTPRNRLAAEILNEIDSIATEESLGKKAFIDYYRKRSIVINKEVLLFAGGNKYDAKVLDIDNNGCLVVEYPDGKIQSLSYGEITLRWHDNENK